MTLLFPYIKGSTPLACHPPYAQSISLLQLQPQPQESYALKLQLLLRSIDNLTSLPRFHLKFIYFKPSYKTRQSIDAGPLCFI